MNDNPFRNSQNTRFLKELFFETTTSDKQNVMYTLKEADHLGYRSFYQAYLELNDPTEYLVATTLVDGVEHWDLLCRCKWFQPHLSKMRRALELRIKSDAIRMLMADAASPESKTSAASAKYILDKGYSQVVPDKRKAGRPSKEEISAAANEEAEAQKILNDDFKRIQALQRTMN